MCGQFASHGVHAVSMLHLLEFEQIALFGRTEARGGGGGRGRERRRAAKTRGGALRRHFPVSHPSSWPRARCPLRGRQGRWAAHRRSQRPVSPPAAQLAPPPTGGDCRWSRYTSSTRHERERGLICSAHGSPGPSCLALWKQLSSVRASVGAGDARLGDAQYRTDA